MKINETIRDILAECSVDGNLVRLPDTKLERSVYLEVNKVLEALGGKWSRKDKAHKFDYSPDDALEEVVLGGEFTDLKKELQFFETPEELAIKLCDMAEITPECSVIEPSVGKGRIANEIAKRRPKNLRCFEINPGMERYLKDKAYKVDYSDFLAVDNNKVTADRIVMNPPFSKQQDIDHVYKAYECLNPNGILVSVMSTSHTYRTDKKSERFKDFLNSIGADVEILPQDTFKESGTMANACVVKIRKPV